MRVQRAEIITKYSMKGMTIPDVCFQNTKLNLSKVNKTEYIADTPSMIRLPSNFGVKLTNLGFMNIPVTDEESYYLAKNNPILKYQPKAHLFQGGIKIYIGMKTAHTLNGGPGIAAIVDCFEKRKGALISMILDNPDDAENYDWTKSQYPMPSEMIGELKKQLLRRDFQLMLQTKSDQIPNAKNDTLRYHDQGRVQNQ